MNPEHIERLILTSLVKDYTRDNFRRTEARDFWFKTNRIVWEAIRQLAAGDAYISTKTIADTLKDTIDPIEAQQIGEVLAFIKEFYAPVDFDYYYAMLREQKIKREATKYAQFMLKAMHEEEMQPEEALVSMMENARKLLGGQSSECFTMEDLVKNFSDGKPYLEVLEERRRKYLAGESTFDGIETGYKGIDDIIGGFKKGTYTVIAASTSAGKTTFMLNVIDNILERANPNVLFITLEMTTHQIFDKNMAMGLGIGALNIERGNITREQLERAKNLVQTIKQRKLTLDASVPMDINYLMTKTETMMQESGCDAVFVDYMTLLKTGARYQNKHLEVDAISKGLQHLAKKTKIPVIALAQLNRGVLSRADTAPQLGDIRESGSPEEDADVVIMIDRPNRDKENDYTNAYIRKNRNYGTLGRVQFEFKYGRLHELRSISAEIKDIHNDEFDQFSPRTIKH